MLKYRPEVFPGDELGNPRFWPNIFPSLTAFAKTPLDMLDHCGAFVGKPLK
jgi:hypothetical protein